jgi:putative DNA primase/helicase
MLFSDMIETETHHIMPGVLAEGLVSLLIAAGGAGKSIVSCDLAARVSRGFTQPPWPLGDPEVDPDDVATPGQAIMAELEDSATSTVLPRLRAAGADLTRIDDISHVERTSVTGAALRSRFGIGGTDGGDLGLLRRRITELGDVRLVVIGPIMSAATSTVSYNQQMRLKVIDPLSELCADTGVAGLVIGHFTKGSTGITDPARLIDYVGGSKGLTDAVRLASVIVPSKDNPEVKMLMSLKSNMGTLPKPLEFRIAAEGFDDPDAHVEWKQPPLSLTSGAAMARIEQRVVRELTAAGRPMSAQELAMALGVTFQVVSMVLVHARKERLVERRRGAWSLAPSTAPVLTTVGG